MPVYPRDMDSNTRRKAFLIHEAMVCLDGLDKVWKAYKEPEDEYEQEEDDEEADDHGGWTTTMMDPNDTAREQQMNKLREAIRNW